MQIELIINSRFFLSFLENEDVDKIYEILIYMDKFPHINIFTYDDATNDIYELLYSKRNIECYKLISRWLDRTKNNGKDILIFNNDLYDKKNNILKNLINKESNSMKGILLNNEFFDYKTFLACLSNSSGIREIHDTASLKDLLILFCYNEKDIQSFIHMLDLTFDRIEFDENIVDSIKTLEAGFESRKKEILYHLYCIESEIPVLMKQYKGNQEIGAHMSIPCSPEKNRKLVEIKLTKRIEGKEIKCELHTKLKKLGDRKPDRIYFSPQVGEHILNKNKQDIIGKIYIYKISEHV